MKKVLMGTTALLGVGLMAGTAAASDGVKLSLGGFMRNQFGAMIDDDSNGEAGDDINAVGVGTDAEIYFLGSVTLDNGVTVGARIELEGGDENEDQIDVAYAFFKGGFGDVRIGSQAGAAANLYMLPPGSTANFGPYSPNSIGNTLVSPAFFDIEGSTANQDKSQKLAYYSPNFGGFSFGVSYTPNDNEKDYNGGDDGNDNADQQWRAASAAGDADNNFGLGAHYDFEGDGWGLAVGGAAYWEGDLQDKAAGTDEQAGYNAGINVNFGGLTIGVAGTYLENTTVDFDNSKGEDTWVIGTGLSYNVDAWTVGAGWAHSESDAAGFSDSDIINRFGVTGSYAMGPGIDLDAGIFYSTREAADDSSAEDNYDGVEFAVGSSISF